MVATNTQRNNLTAKKIQVTVLATANEGWVGQRICWHPAIIQWCLFLRHLSSGVYSTLQNSGILKLPSERTLREYRHFAPAVIGFSANTDKQLLEMVNLQKPAELAKYVSIVIDEMYVKEKLNITVY